MSPRAAQPPVGEEQERRYVWDALLRTIHWSLFVSIVTLTVTGLYVADPFMSGAHVMRWMRLIHFIAATLFTLAVLARIVWMFTGTRTARWDQLLPTSRARLRELLGMVKYYAWPVGAPPQHDGHNPLAGLSYLGFYLLCLGLVATGLALYAPGAHVSSPLRWFAFLGALLGGLQTARWLHHVLMWGVLLFSMLHIYLAVFNARVARNGIIDSIVSGFRFAGRGGHGR
jgi:Ni/Fe-hydrogenase 1 B-type cytochrome subunit